MGVGRSRTFLTTDWLNLLGVTYAVDESLLVPHLPRGTEIDKLDGASRVSLVAFEFRRTRVRGVAIPGHVNFPEINLRFYVRLGDKRAVVFIRELVPRPMVALVARLFYNEPYRTIRMRETVVAPGGASREQLAVRHDFGAGLRNRIEAVANPIAVEPEPDSAEYWLTHHDLGVGTGRDGRTRSYLVEHPVWALHEVTELSIEVDFAGIYGEQWGFLADTEPSHVTLAAGSEVRIAPPETVASASLSRALRVS